jgi:glycosyltransferase involved in cell wall biosynthesis
MISVIIMTYNPKRHIFEQTLNALKGQDLPYHEWELILVDNASKNPVRDEYSLDWHPNGVIVEEPELGCVNARIKAVQIAKSDWYVFVDDDNILSHDYLSIAKRIIEEKPYLGCFGGNQVGRFFEKQPSPEVLKYLEMIAVRRIGKDRISNMYIWETTPASAGAVIRAEVVKRFVYILQNEKSRFFLGRRGTSLMSSEDIDMAYVSIDMGYMNGLIQELSLEHCIPASRLEHSYLINLRYYNRYSTYVLDYIRFKRKPKLNNLLYYIRQTNLLFKGKTFDFKMNKSERKAIVDVHSDLNSKKFTIES